MSPFDGSRALKLQIWAVWLFSLVLLSAMYVAPAKEMMVKNDIRISHVYFVLVIRSQHVRAKKKRLLTDILAFRNTKKGKAEQLDLIIHRTKRERRIFKFSVVGFIMCGHMFLQRLKRILLFVAAEQTTTQTHRM